MAATTVKSENITNIEASPLVTLDRKKGRVKTIIDQKAVATTSLDEVADTLLFGPIPSNAVITDLSIMNDDLDSGTPALAVDVGLAYSGTGGNQALNGNTSGTAVDVDCFATAIATLQAATTTWQSVRFETADITSVSQEAWEVGALTSDPGGLLYISLQVTTVAGTAATGDLVVKIDYI